jgi:hypothetical protein
MDYNRQRQEYMDACNLNPSDLWHKHNPNSTQSRIEREHDLDGYTRARDSIQSVIVFDGAILE